MAERIICLIFLFLTILALIFGLIVGANQVSLIVTGQKITEEASIFWGNNLVFLSDFDVILILSVFVLIIILAVIFVYILDELAKERTRAKNYRKEAASEIEKERVKTKNYHRKVVKQIERLVKHKDGKIHFVTKKLELKNDQESFESLLAQSSPDWKDAVEDVLREISEY